MVPKVLEDTMKFLSRIAWMVSMSLASMCFWMGCSDEGPSNGGPPDTTPPVVASVAPMDESHVRVTFNEKVSRPSAERTDHYSIEVITAAEAPPSSSRHGERTGDPERALPTQVEILTAALQSDGKNVLLTTGANMGTVAYNMLVNGVSDVNGNKMTEVSTTEFTGVNTPDITAPFVIVRSPRSGATGVGTSEPVAITFSEPMWDVSVLGAFSWISSNDTVITSLTKDHDNEYVFSPLSPLEHGTSYTVILTQDAHDWAGNSLAKTSWQFTTMSAIDTTPPTLVSTVPADGAVDVSTGTVFILTFSERINPASLENVLVTPTPSEGTEEWSSDGLTVTFTPDEPLLEDTQYFLMLPEGSIQDLSGNLNTENYTVGFTTGSSLESGRIEGTLSGDLYSAGAGDPTGAAVIATTSELFGDGELDIFGIAFAGGNDAYSVPHLPDTTYYPFAILDSNNDGILDPETGDAFGAYGLDIRAMDFTQTEVAVDAGGIVGDVDFPLYDAEAISGTVLYYGDIPSEFRASLMYFVGAFDSETFDPDNPGNPAAWTEDGPLAWDAEYAINDLDDGLMPGTYYIGAYIDVNSNGLFDSAIDPSGFYSNMQSGIPYPITVEDGGDATNVDIYLEMPSGGALTLPSGKWKEIGSASKNSLSLERMSAKLREALQRRGAK